MSGLTIPKQCFLDWQQLLSSAQKEPFFCETSDPFVTLPQHRWEVVAFVLLLGRVGFHHWALCHTAQPCQQQLSPQSSVKSGSPNIIFWITEITAGNQGSIYPEINPEAAEIPVGHKSPDAATLQDPEKFAVVSENFWWALLWGRMRAPSASGTTSIIHFKL